MIRVDDQSMPWHDGMTVASLLEQLSDTDCCSVVRLNGKLISSPKFDKTQVPDDSVIQLLPLVAGG